MYDISERKRAKKLIEIQNAIFQPCSGLAGRSGAGRFGSGDNRGQSPIYRNIWL
jgi:hypothetical protein